MASSGDATPRMVATHWAGVTYSGISRSTWRVTVWRRWRVVLGWLRAESGHGPLMKFETREMLYIFHSRYKEIRETDYEIVRLQSGCVSELTMINILQQMTVKIKCK
jgi:hypothetical protein